MEVSEAVDKGNPRNGKLREVPIERNHVNVNLSNTQKVPAVTVRSAYKSYGKSTVALKNFNMTVQEGTIYSLLGSSGCGKTTILSAIVGLKQLDGGKIRLFGEVAGSVASGVPGRGVGHMPQEYSLHSEFTIQESLAYYGRIYEMSKEEVQERSEFLVSFFKLPKATQRICTLSGGQKRRVSLAIALIHEPRLLILDEPTVGVDQLLRESIWNLLRDFVSLKKTTVIITTHYLEESRGSDTIGLMRNGRLLTEKNPLRLLEEHNATLLEEVVLTLSKNDTAVNQDEINGDDKREVDNSTSATPNTIEDLNYNREEENEFQMSNVYEDRTAIKDVRVVPRSKNSAEETEQFSIRSPLSFSRLRALVNKNIISLFRNLIFLAFNFFSPALQIVVVCLAIGNQPFGLSFGVVNHENPFSCHEATLALSNFTDSQCEPANWSCIFLDTLPKDGVLKLVPYETESGAVEDIKRGKIWGYVSLPANFSYDMRERFIASVFPSDESIVGSTISLQMDMSSQTIGSSLEKIFIETLMKFSKRVLRQCEYDERVGDLLLVRKEPIYGSEDIAFREFLAPSILLGLLFFFPLCASSISYITDKKTGTLDRSLVAGVTNLEIMFANLVTQTLVLFGQAGFAFVMMIFVFKITIHGSVFSAVLLAILIGIGGMSLGFLISTFVHEEIQAVLLAMGMFFPNFLLAGMVWPVEGMPLILQYISYFLPCTLACEAMRSIISRGWGVLHWNVWTGFASTIAWIIIYWVSTILIHKITRRKN